MADFDIQKIADSISKTLAEYLQNFIDILCRPRQAISKLLGLEQQAKKIIGQQVIAYTLISVALGMCLAQLTHLPGSPSLDSPSIVLGVLVTWLLVGLALHPILKIFRAKGTIYSTITVFLYIVSTLHLILVPVTSALSDIVTDTKVVLNYDYVVQFGSWGNGFRDKTEESYIKEVHPEKEGTVLVPADRVKNKNSQRIDASSSPYPRPARREYYVINDAGLTLSIVYYLIHSFYLAQGLSVVHRVKTTYLVILTVMPLLVIAALLLPSY